MSGAVRLDRSTTALAERLRPGEVAVLDHLDLDRASAERLLDRGVAAVVNVAPSLSGRVPAQGAAALLAAGVPLLDDVGAAVFAAVREGERVHLDLDEGTLTVGGQAVAHGTLATSGAVRAAADRAAEHLSGSLDTLVADVADLLEREPALLLDGPPRVPVVLQDDRPVLVVGADPRAAAELATLSGWIRRVSPVLVAVGVGARVVRAAGLRADLLVGDVGPGAATSGAGRATEGAAHDPHGDANGDPHGDLSGLGERVLRPGGEVVALHASAAAHAEEVGVAVCFVPSQLPPLAVALAVVGAAEPPVVVTAGIPGGLADLLDGGRPTAAATLLGRLRLDGCLVDASTLRVLLRPPRGVPRVLPVLLVLAVALLAALAVLAVSGPGQAVLHRWWPGLSPR